MIQHFYKSILSLIIICWNLIPVVAKSGKDEPMTANTGGATYAFSSPIAVNDSYTMSNFGAYNASVLANDSDPDGDALTVNTIPVTGPLYGTLTLRPDGTFTYSPNASFSSTDSFTYRVCDNGSPSQCAQATVTIGVPNPYFNPVGTTAQLAVDCFRLTSELSFDVGGVWRITPLDLNNSFDLSFKARFSAALSTVGGDGLTFSLQKQGLSTLGNAGGELGMGGISPSVSIEFDTYYNGSEPTEDHIAVQLNGNFFGPGYVPVQASPTSTNIKDGAFHDIRITWDKLTNTFNVYFDGSLRTTYADDIINNVFGGSSTVYWGFTAGCGGAVNEHTVCNIRMNNDSPLAVDDPHYMINEDGALNATTVLSNDIDPNGNSLVPNLTSSPATGSFLFKPDGTFTFTPLANTNGTFTFQYRVCDTGTPSLCSPPATVTITVNAVNDAPVFTKGANQTVNEDAGLQTVSGWATGMGDGDPELNQTLNFTLTNDNNALFSAQPSIDPATGTLTYTPAPNSNGVATVTVVLRDDGSDIAPNVSAITRTFTITVNPVNDVPAAGNDTYATNEDSPLMVAAPGVLANDTDVENNPLNSIILTQPPNGAVVMSNNGSFTYTPNTNFNGVDSFTYRACDNGSPSQCGTGTVTVTVNSINDAPVFVKGSNVTVNEDAGLQTMSNWATGVDDGDPELSQTLLFNLTNDSPSLFAVQPAISASGTLTFTPVPDKNGSATVTVTLEDNGSGVAPNVRTSDTQTFTITITPVNDAPVFVKGTNQVVNEDAGSRTITGWATGIGDGDPELSQTLTFTVTNDNNLLFSVQPAISPTGTLTYTSAPNINGVATVTVVLSDNGSGVLPNVNTSVVQTFTITISPVNDAPVAAADAYSTNEDTPLSIAASGVLTNDTDLDGDVLRPILATGPSNGTLILNTNGSFSYSPNLNFNGADSFTYYANDSKVNSGTPATVTITVIAVNDAPVISNIHKSGPEDTDLAFVAVDFTGAYTDVENDPLQKIRVTALPANGTLLLNGTPVTLNQEVVRNDLNNLVFRPVANFNGGDQFGWNGYDGKVYASSAAKINIVITPVNDPPVAENDSAATAEDNAVTVAVMDNDSDVDGPLSPAGLSVVSNPAKGRVSVNITSGMITYTPNPDYNGTDTFTYQICDGDSPALCAQATVTVTVTPVNDAPVAKDDQVETRESTPLHGSTLLSNDSDVDRDTLKVTITPVVAPLHGTLELHADGTFIYTPDAERNAEYFGPDSFTYEVCDSGNPTLCAQATVSINVIRTIDLLVYEGISPNHDNKNDSWFIRDIDLYPNNKVSIYNRWGNLVYEARGYDNVHNTWAGTSNQGRGVGGNELPDGTYFYVISLGDGSKPLKGSVVINR